METRSHKSAVTGHRTQVRILIAVLCSLTSALAQNSVTVDANGNVINVKPTNFRTNGHKLMVDGVEVTGGGGGAGLSNGDKGDITVSGSPAGSVWTINNGTISLAKMANMATASFLGRSTAGTGAPEVLSVSAAKTLLNLSGTNTGDQIVPANTTATSNQFFSAYNSTTGAFTKTQPLFTGLDFTSSNLTSIATRNATALNMATGKVLGRQTAGTGSVEELSRIPNANNTLGAQLYDNAGTPVLAADFTNRKLVAGNGAGFFGWSNGFITQTGSDGTSFLQVNLSSGNNTDNSITAFGVNATGDPFFSVDGHGNLTLSDDDYGTHSVFVDLANVTGQRTLHWPNASGTVALTQSFTPEMYGAVGDGSTNDLTALNNAFTAAKAVHGKVHLGAKTYAITDEWVIDDSVTIEGEGCLALNGSRATTINTLNAPLTSPYLTGSVILQKTAAKNGIRITAAGRTMNLRGFGVRFADSIKFSNTGHGIFSQPPVVSTYRDNGVFYGDWDNVSVYGVDGNHYGFYLINPICSTFTALNNWGGGGLLIENNSSGGGANFGNTVFTNFYDVTFVNGSAHGIYLKGTTVQLNFLTFIRPQAMTIDMGSDAPGVTAPTSAQKTFICDANVNNFHLIGPDFESGVGSGVSIPDASMSGSFISPGWIDNALANGRIARMGVDGIAVGPLPASTVSGMGNHYLMGTAHGAQMMLGLNGTEQAALTVYDGFTYWDFTGGLTLRNYNSGSPVNVGTLDNSGVLTLTGGVTQYTTNGNLSVTGNGSGTVDIIQNTTYPTVRIGKDTTHYGNLVWDSGNNAYTFQTYSNSYPITLQGSAITLSSAVTLGNGITGNGSGLTNLAIGNISGLGTGVGASLAIANNTAGGYSPIDGAATLSNKSISLGSNTVTGTTTQFNTALSGDDFAFVGTANTFTAAQINSTSGAASTPAMKYSGVPFAGTGTTSFPLVYLNDANATASTTLATSGTSFGVNAHSGIGNLIDLLLDGTSKFKVSSTGAVTGQGGITIPGNSKFGWSGASGINCTADGNIILTNNASSGFTRLDFQGTSNSASAIGWDAVNGFTLQSAAGTATWNDNSTASSGTVANRYLFGIAAPTLTATNTSVTNTVGSTVYIGGAPTASTNTTITTPYAFDVAAGVSNFGGPVVIAASYTVATLPSTAATGKVLGAHATITDGDASLAWGATAVNSGAGATKYLVWYNGTNWTVLGK